MRLPKIVCTLGPATAGVDMLVRMIEAGMDVGRLNFSHGDHDTHRRAIEELREAARRAGRPVGVLADISGPKIRLQDIEGGAVPVEAGQPVVLTTDDCPGSAQRVGVNFKGLADCVQTGGQIFIDDGLIELIVERVQAPDVYCRVKVGGVLKSRKGINLPQASLAAPAITAKDRENIAFARGLGVDFFAMSFVRSAEDVRQAQALAGGIPVIAKIEKPQAVEQLEAIADVADGCMVARGDLGIEIGQHKVPLLQKRIIREMNRRARPVITATQMLESMVSSAQPTRAEVSDVANAVLDGSDALMLSAESAVGRHPVLVVQTMARIIEEVQPKLGDSRADRHVPAAELPLLGAQVVEGVHAAVARATAQAVASLRLGIVAVYTDSGQDARLLAAQRPAAVILGLCHDEAVLTRLTLTRGVQPVSVPRPRRADDALSTVERVVLERGLARPGDTVAVSLTFEEDYDPRLTSGLLLIRIRWPA
jgi:pyruvate kinase